MHLYILFIKMQIILLILFLSEYQINEKFENRTGPHVEGVGWLPDRFIIVVRFNHCELDINSVF